MAESGRQSDTSQDQLEVVIGTSPSGSNLFPEIRLVKPALLYGDRVRLFSPMATLLAGISALSHVQGVERAEVMQAIAEAMGESQQSNLMETARTLIQLDSLPRATRRKMLGAAGAKDVRQLVQKLDEAWVELRQKVEILLEEAGAGELELALESGLVQVESLLDEERPTSKESSRCLC